MKKVLLILTIVLVVVVAVAVPVGLKLLSEKQVVEPEAAPATTLSLRPEAGVSAGVNAGEEFEVEVVINTNENLVVSTDVTLTFDRDKLEATEIEQGIFFENDWRETISEGSVRMAYYNNSPRQSNGEAVVATVTFKVLSTANGGTGPIQTTIDFDEALTRVGGGSPELVHEDKGVDVLDGVTPTTITILAGNGVQPSVTPTPSPTGSAGTTPTPTPTGGPGTTPTPTPTGRATTPTPTGQSGTTPTLTPTRTSSVTPVPTTPPMPVTADWGTTLWMVLIGGGLLLLGIAGMAVF